MKRISFNHIIYSFLMVGLVFSLGFSSWVYIGKTETENGVVTKGDEHTVSIKTRKYSNDVSTTTEYFVPDQFENHYNITYKLGSDGKPITTKINIQTTTDKKASANNVGKSLAGATLNYDEMVQYYDNGKAINQRGNMTITPQEPFASYYTEVKTWKATSSSTTFSRVWDCCIKASETPDGKGNLGSNDYYYFKIQGDSGNTLSGHGPGKYNCPSNQGDVIGEEYLISNNEYDNGAVIEQVYGRIVCREKIEELVYSNKVSYKVPGCNSYSTTSYANWNYYPSFEMRMVRTTKKTGTVVEEDYLNKIQVKDKEKITPKDLGISGYDTMGFFSNGDCDTLFDFTQPITSDIVIYAKEYPTDNVLVDAVAANTGALNLYDSLKTGTGTGNSLDLSTLKNYDSKLRAAFLKKATIRQSSTLNVTFNDSQIINGKLDGTDDDVNSCRSADTSAALDYNGNNYVGFDSSTFLLLNGDLTINGTLNVGAKIGGSATTRQYYSYIIDTYTSIDLYGHDIIVDGGVLNCYGLIKDSVGTGKIIVKNDGKITATLSVSDGKDRDQNVIGLRMRQFPFNDYRFNYLQVPVEIQNGCSFGAFLRVDATANICNASFNIIGNYSSTNSVNSVFAWKNTNKDEKVDYIPYKIDELSTPSTSSLYLQMHNWRNRFIFDADMREVDSLMLTLSAKVSQFQLDMKVDLARYDVPISSFFDLILNSGRTMDVYSKMTFFPGSMFYCKKGSKLWFKSKGNTTYASSEASGLGVQKETRYIAGGIMTFTSRISNTANGYSYSSYSDGIMNDSNYWNYVKYNNVIIDGGVSFDAISDNLSDSFYYLSGEIGLSNEALSAIELNKNSIKTYDFKAMLNNSFMYSNAHSSSNYFYAFATGYNCNPLISGNKAYIIDENHLWKGTYSIDSGIFKNDDSTQKDAILLTDTDILEDGSTGSNSGSSRVDRNITIAEVDKAYEEYRIAKVQNDYYAYIAGLYVPILDNTFSDSTVVQNGTILAANERKFMSNREADYQRSLTTYTKKTASTFSMTSGILSIKPKSSTNNSGLIINETTGDKTNLTADCSLNNEVNLTVSNSSYGSVTVNVDSTLKMSVQKNITAASNMSVVDNSSASKTATISTTDGSKNKTTTTISISGSTIKITSKYDSTGTSNLTINVQAGRIQASSSGYTTSYSDSVTCTSELITHGNTYSSFNFAGQFDRGLIQFVSSSKRWKHYGFANYPKDSSLDTYYSY